MGSLGAETNQQPSSSSFQAKNAHLDHDVLIIGAGLSGIYATYRMRQLGLRSLVLEAAPSVGGTWFWNRYPGARFDSESYSYNFFFSPELLAEWRWSEHFAPQPETLRYCEFVCDRFDLQQDMQFDTRVRSAWWRDDGDDDAKRGGYWVLTDEAGKKYTARYLITAMGILNAFTLPNVPGVHDFQGQAFHTARWPSEPVSLEGKRVAVLGTGATGIQTIQEVAKTAGHLTVLQRTPNWSAPLRNSKITSEEMAEIQANYPDYRQRCEDSYACFIHMPSNKSIFDHTPEEREAYWEHLYATRGFEKWLSNYKEIGTDREANRLVSEFFARKIRERVHDQVMAEKLIPKCHGFGTKRVPLESGYFEVFNQPNVRLKDIQEDPIDCVTAKGIKTRDEEMEFDIIIYATGFDAVTGAFTAVDFRGVNGVKLGDVWAEGPRTFLGLFVQEFPNMMMIMGPHQMFGNIPRSIEYATGWLSEFLEFCRDNAIIRAECTAKSVKAWTEHVHSCAVGLLANEVDSWMTGVNKNLSHKQKRIIARYNGSAPGYRERTRAIAEGGYQDLRLSM